MFRHPQHFIISSAEEWLIMTFSHFMMHSMLLALSIQPEWHDFIISSFQIHPTMHLDQQIHKK